MNAATYKKDITIGNDLTVHRLGFGAMRITGNGVWGPPADKNEALNVLKRAVELGVNFIDTADSYGPHVSEELIAEALHPYPAGLVIATKGGLERSGPNIWTSNADPAYLQKCLEGSLKRLKLDVIDLYQLHRIDSKVPAEKTFEFLQNAQKEGKIKHIGLSEVTVEEIQHAQQFFDVVSVQNMYSFDNRKWEGVLKFCKQQKIAFIPWYPVNAGNAEKLKTLTDIANHHHATTHQVALSWLLHHADNIILIPGTSKLNHLEENMKSGDIQLTEDELQELGSITVAI